jgi:energy-converting hydrogenase Eha subunit A
MMLAALVVLVIIAVLMALAVMARGKPKRREE